MPLPRPEPLLQAALSRLCVQGLKPLPLMPPEGGSAGPWSPSARFEVRAGNTSWVLVCKALAALHPKQAHEQRLCLQDWLRQQEPANAYGVLMAPFISARVRQDLFAAGVGCVDQAGNALLAFGSSHIEKEVPGNPVREQRELRSFFTPKAMQVVRTLLLHPRAWPGHELARAAGVSAAHVSQVRNALVERGWAQSARAGVRVTQPWAVLDAWQQARGPAQGSYKAYTTLHGAALTQALQALQAEPLTAGRVLLAGASCAQYVAPYVRANALFLLVHETVWPRVQSELKLQSGSAGANVQVYVSPHLPDFQDAVELTPALQGVDLYSAYVQMYRQGERMREAAQHLRQERLVPLWQREGLSPPESAAS